MATADKLLRTTVAPIPASVVAADLMVDLFDVDVRGELALETTLPSICASVVEIENISTGLPYACKLRISNDVHMVEGWTKVMRRDLPFSYLPLNSLAEIVTHDWPPASQ